MEIQQVTGIPLEWRGRSASMPFGEYRVESYGKSWGVYLNRDLVVEREGEEAAKTAAQEDFDYRLGLSLPLTAPNERK